MFKLSSTTSKSNELRTHSVTPSASKLLNGSQSNIAKSVSSSHSSNNNSGTSADASGNASQSAVSALTKDLSTDSLADTSVQANEFSADTKGSRLLVGPDVKLKGAEILDCDTLVVEGSVEATMDSRTICIAENGKFDGTVSVDTAEIFGTFEGDLTARNRLIIHSTGRVSGKIRYGKVVIEEGGQVFGDIQSNASVTGVPGTATESGKTSRPPVMVARA
ncbi:MAG TPA: polymer-forming cytoskeletal protein [Rugosibacter sp.]|nr:polymer-forming cytoskeletal protein [Rugosibacter sp.]HQQ34495.1 polymer-forming cytoskeletal protein [Rugosibacter sp.]